jgi:hypothetical protein
LVGEGYSFQKSEQIPRLDDQELAVATQARGLWEFVSRRYVAACEALLRRDLIRDYALTVEDLDSLRGRVSPGLATTAVCRGV